MYRPLEWQINLERFIQQAGIEGITFQWPGERFCTNCAVCADLLVTTYCKDNPGIHLNKRVELCFGSEVKAKKDSEKVFLIGDCAIRANKDNKNAIKVEGCPPKIVKSMITVINNTLEKKRARKVIASRLFKGLSNKLGLYNEYFPHEFAYEPPEFNPEHF